MKKSTLLPLAATLILTGLNSCRLTDEITASNHNLQMDQQKVTSSFDNDGDPPKDKPKDRDYMKPIKNQ